MSLSAEIKLRIPFHDVDIMHIAWHGHYSRYFEIARTALMQSCELDWVNLRDLRISMPIVDLQIQYRKPLTYDTEFLVKAEIKEFDYPELKVHYKIVGLGDGQIRSTGITRQVYVSLDEQRSLFDVPSEIKRRLANALEKSL